MYLLLSMGGGISKTNSTTKYHKQCIKYMQMYTISMCNTACEISRQKAVTFDYFLLLGPNIREGKDVYLGWNQASYIHFVYLNMNARSRALVCAFLAHSYRFHWTVCGLWILARYSSILLIPPSPSTWFYNGLLTSEMDNTHASMGKSIYPLGKCLKRTSFGSTNWRWSISNANLSPLVKCPKEAYKGWNCPTAWIISSHVVTCPRSGSFILAQRS
jgi:hypothetical protein